MPHLSALSLALNRPGAVSLEQVVASLFAAGEQGAWYDPSAANVTWRRNLLTYTEQFDNADWPKLDNAISVTANATTAPDGTATADALYETAVTQEFTIQRLAVNTQGVSACISIYAKAGTRRRIALGMTSTGGVASVNWVIFDLIDKNVVANAGAGTAFNIQEVAGTGGWCRLHISKAVVDGSSDRFVVQICRDSDTTPPAAYLGDVGNYLYVWGAQSERGVAPTAYQRIVTPEITYLADVQSQPLLFQDSTGATPVTAVEQPVGLILDKRKGLVLGSELVTNGTFDTTTTGWTASGVAPSVSGGVLTLSGGTGYFYQTFPTVVGRHYKVTGDIIQVGTAFSAIRKADDASFSVNVVTIASAVGSASAYFIATATTTYIFLQHNFSVTDAKFDNISVKLLDGNHAYQTGSAARPVLRARYNLLTYSEQFNDASWQKLAAGTGVAPVVTANAGTAPDGTTTADRVVLDRGAGTTLSDVSRVFQSATAPASGTSVFSVWMRSYDGSSSYTVRLVCGNGTSNVTVTPTWTRFSVVSTDTSTNAQIRLQGDQTQQTADILAWGGHINYGTSAGDYQRIAAATDYATTSTITGQPFRPYLLFDGGDDCLFTASVDYSSSDEMTVAASISKRSDAAQGTVVELSSTSTNAGAFGLLAPLGTGGGNDNFTFRSAGATTWSDAIGTSYVAPTTRVVVGQGDISADQSILRVDKTQVATSATDQGAGNYTNAAMFIGRRNNSSQPLSAWLYGLIVRGKTCTAGEVAAVETYLAEKAGLTL